MGNNFNLNTNNISLVAANTFGDLPLAYSQIRQEQLKKSAYNKYKNDLGELFKANNPLPESNSKVQATLDLSGRGDELRLQAAILGKALAELDINKIHEKLGIGSGGGGEGFASKGAGWAGAAAKVSDAFSGLVGEKREYNGPNATLSKGLDTTYDAAADAALSSGNPYAMMAGAAMKVMGLGNTALNKMGAGTDGMTKADAFTSSNWGFLLSGGLSSVNGLLGNYSEKFSIDLAIQANLGDSYNSTYDDLNEAADKSNKKYGLISSGARRKANREMVLARMRQDKLSQINENAQDAKDASNYEGISIRNQMNLNGGYKSLKAAKHGLKLTSLQFAHKLLIGGLLLYNDVKRTPIVIPEIDWNELTTNLKDTSSKKLDNRIQEIKDFILKNNLTNLGELDLLGINSELADYWDNFTNLSDEDLIELFKDIAKANQSTDSIYYSGNGGGQLNNNIFTPSASQVEKIIGYNDKEMPLLDGILLQYANLFGYKNIEAPTSDYAYAYKLLEQGLNDKSYDEQQIYNLLIPYENNIAEGDLSSIPEDKRHLAVRYLTEKNINPNYNNGIRFKKQGGTINFFDNYVTIQPYTLEEIQKFKEGGSFNVIPDGALHKNKHHMEDAEGLTKKGIPVVTEEKGEYVQQAEIERDEIIFCLEVTNKLEELLKKYKENKEDSYLIEAGKLLTKEILYNTHDNTNLLKK